VSVPSFVAVVDLGGFIDEEPFGHDDTFRRRLPRRPR